MKKLNLFQVIWNEINLEGRVLSARLENKSRENQTVISSMLPKKEKPEILIHEEYENKVNGR